MEIARGTLRKEYGGVQTAGMVRWVMGRAEGVCGGGVGARTSSICTLLPETLRAQAVSTRPQIGSFLVVCHIGGGGRTRYLTATGPCVALGANLEGLYSLDSVSAVDCRVSEVEI